MFLKISNDNSYTNNNNSNGENDPIKPVIVLTIVERLEKKKRDLLLYINKESREDLYLEYIKKFPDISKCKLEKEYTLPELESLKEKNLTLYTKLKICGYIDFQYYLIAIELWFEHARENDHYEMSYSESFKLFFERCSDFKTNLSTAEANIKKCLMSQLDFITLKTINILEQFPDVDNKSSSRPIVASTISRNNPAEILDNTGSVDLHKMTMFKFSNDDRFTLKKSTAGRIQNAYTANEATNLQYYEDALVGVVNTSATWGVTISGTLIDRPSGIELFLYIRNEGIKSLGNITNDKPFSIFTRLKQNRDQVAQLYVVAGMYIAIKNLIISFENQDDKDDGLFIFTNSPKTIVSKQIENNDTCIADPRSYIKSLSHIDIVKTNDPSLFDNLLQCKYIKNLASIAVIERWLSKTTRPGFFTFLTNANNNYINTITSITNFNKLSTDISKL